MWPIAELRAAARYGPIVQELLPECNRRLW
jgi:hypothetical protein